MANMTVTTGAKFVPEEWLPEVRAFLKAKLVLGSRVKLINFRGSGDTIHIPDVSALSTNDKAASTDVTFQAPTETEFTMAITKHKESSFLIEDILKVQSAYDLRREYTMSAGYAIGKQMDDDIWALVNASFAAGNKVIGGDGTTQWDPTANTNTGNGTDLTDAGIRKMIETLDAADVPQEGRVLAIHPSQKNVLLGLSRFTEFQLYGTAGPIHTGTFGEIYGVEVIVTSQSPSVNATDASTPYRVGLMFQRNALVLAKQLDPRVQGDYFLEKLAWGVVIDSIYNTAIFRQNHAIGFYTPA